MISVPRQRIMGEITPVRAEQSATRDNNEKLYGAGRAIDLVLETHSWTVAGTDGTVWLKITLDEDKTYCVEKVIWYRSTGAPHLTWTCGKDDCSNCVGDRCSYFTLTVSTEGAVSDLSPVSDCKYGDTVKLERRDGSVLSVIEIVVIGKGKSKVS